MHSLWRQKAGHYLVTCLLVYTHLGHKMSIPSRLSFSRSPSNFGSLPSVMILFGLFRAKSPTICIFFALFFEIYRFWQFKAVILPPISKLHDYVDVSVIKNRPGRRQVCDHFIRSVIRIIRGWFSYVVYCCNFSKRLRVWVTMIESWSPLKTRNGSSSD